MESTSTSVPNAASKKRSLSLDSSLAVIRDLEALAARGLSVNLAQSLPDRGLQDAEILQHQQCYCRYALHDSNTPARSWRSRSVLQKNASCQAKQSRRPEAAQHSPANFSPFQAVANCCIQPGFPSSPSASPSEADAASLAWEDCLSPGQNLISSPDDGTGLQDPQLSVLSTTVGHITNDLHFHQLTTHQHIGTSVSQVSQDPDLLHMDTALSMAPDTLSPHTSLSLPLPALPSPSVVRQSAMSWGEDSCSMPSEIRLQLTSAPAMFAQPIGINKAILPAFQAHVEVCSEVPTQIHVKLVAYLLTSEQVLRLDSWNPHSHVMSETISGGTAEAAVVCNTKDGIRPDGSLSYKGSCFLTLKDMRFASSSRMRPRWLVLTMVLPNQDVLLVHYKVPTIIMSRTCDQSEKAAHILQGQLHPMKRIRSEDTMIGSIVSCSQLSDQPQLPMATAFSPPQLSHLSSATQPSQLTLSTPSLADVITRASVSPDGNSQVRTHSSSLTTPSQIMTQAMRSSSLPAQVQNSQGPPQSLEPGLVTQPVAKGMQVQTQDQSWSSSQQSSGKMIPCQSAMMSSWLSLGGADSSPMQHDLEPMSPSQSDLFASLFPLDDNSRQLSCSPDIQLPSGLLSSQDSPASHLSSGSQGASQPTFLHSTQDSRQPSTPSHMSQPTRILFSASDSSLGLHDSDLVMLREAIAAAAQPQAPPQHSALMPQSAGQVPLASHPKIAKSASQPVLDPRLRARSLKSREKDSDLRAQPIETKALSWPQSGPYNLQRWQRVLVTLYKSCSLGRALTMQDVWVLGQVAGFHSDPILLATECLSAQQWTDFGEWFTSQLRLLRCHRHMWDWQDPVVMCSFEVDRVQCEHLLQGQAPGTFLIRPSISLTGCMVVSTVADHGGVKHLCLDSRQLFSRPLEVWVRDLVEAQFFLDYRTGCTWRKEQVFLMQYRKFGVVADMHMVQAQSRTAACPMIPSSSPSALRSCY